MAGFYKALIDFIEKVQVAEVAELTEVAELAIFYGCCSFLSRANQKYSADLN